MDDIINIQEVGDMDDENLEIACCNVRFVIIVQLKHLHVMLDWCF